MRRIRRKVFEQRQQSREKRCRGAEDMLARIVDEALLTIEIVGIPEGDIGVIIASIEVLQ